ncbi:hypothetical protein Ms3S1_10310 [Methylosinus sp. 3S-1]|nr:MULTISPECIES: hypothetical protein [Methylosinus]
MFGLFVRLPNSRLLAQSPESDESVSRREPPAAARTRPLGKRKTKMLEKFFPKKSTVEALEGELAQIVQRQVGLRTRSAAAVDEAKAARNTLRELLIGSDNGEDHALADNRVLRAERNEAAICDALAALDAREREMRRRLDEARAAECREKRADEMDAAGRAIEFAALRLEKSVTALAGEFSEIIEAIPPDSLTPRRYIPLIGFRDITPTTAAAAALIETLYAAIPEAFEAVLDEISGAVTIRATLMMRTKAGALCSELPINDEGGNALVASGAFHANIVAPLRKLAADLRDPPAPPKATIEPAPFPEVDVVFTSNVAWRDDFAQERVATAWLAKVPKPVAEKAFELGVALRAGTPEASEALTRAAMRPSGDPRYLATLPTPKTVDLGVNLKSLYDAERARLNGGV